jgi:hypothetical protein
MDTPEISEQDPTNSNTTAFVCGIAFVAIAATSVVVVKKVRAKLAARKANQTFTP